MIYKIEWKYIKSSGVTKGTTLFKSLIYVIRPSHAIADDHIIFNASALDSKTIEDLGDFHSYELAKQASDLHYNKLLDFLDFQL